MIIFDTDILTHFLTGHPRVVESYRRANDDVVITVISRIETLQGRFASLMKAVDGTALQLGQQRLDRAESDLAAFRILPIEAANSAEFDRLRQDKKLKKIGRGDLLIAAIVLTHRATLVTRNVKDFRHISGLHIENWAD